MEILLDNIVVAPNLFCVNDGQNYGEFFNHKTKEYQVQIHKAAFIALIEIEYNQTRNEIKIDDAFENENSDFTNTNYCSLRELLNYPKDFLEIMKTYLHIDLLKKIFPSNEKNKYVINSADSIILKDNLFLPLGISNYIIQSDMSGEPYFGGGMYLTPRDMLKFGQLCLNKGQW